MPTPAGEARLAVRTAAAGMEVSTALGWAVAAGICTISYYVLKGLFNFTEDVVGVTVGWIPGVGKWVRSKLENAEHKLVGWVGNAAATSEARMGDAFHATADTMASIGWEIQQQALDYWHVVAWTGKLAKSVATGEAWQEIFHNTIRAQSETTAQMFTRLARQGKAITHADSPPIAAGIAKATRAERARLAQMQAHALPSLREQTRAREDANAKASTSAGSIAAEAEHGIGALWDRVNGLTWRTAGVGAVALVTVALGRLGLSWFRCSNVTKVGRRLCGLDTSLLDSLLFDTLAIVGTLSIVELAEDLLNVEDEIVAGVKAGFRELRPL